MGFRGELNAAKSHPGRAINRKLSHLGSASTHKDVDYVKYELRTSLWPRIIRHQAFLYGKIIETFLHSTASGFKAFSPWLAFEIRKLRGDVFPFIVAMFVVCFIDALITDDEPIFEPVE